MKIRRLISSTTIKTIHPSDQPQNWRADTTYYSPRVKETLNAGGERTRRVHSNLRRRTQLYRKNSLWGYRSRQRVYTSIVCPRESQERPKCQVHYPRPHELLQPTRQGGYLWIPTKHMTAKTMGEFDTDGKILFQVNGFISGQAACFQLTVLKALGYKPSPVTYYHKEWLNKKLPSGDPKLLTPDTTGFETESARANSP